MCSVAPHKLIGFYRHDRGTSRAGERGNVVVDDNVDNVLLKLIVARWDRRDANHQPSTLKPETQYPKPQTTKSQEMQAILPLLITDF